MSEPAPCPFCGAGLTEINEKRMPPTMKGPGQLISVELRHWCDRDDDTFVSSSITIRARSRAQALLVWNGRYATSGTKEA